MNKSTQNGTNCKYSKAAKSDIEEVSFDKSERTCCQKCALGGCFVGLCLVIGGIISAFIMKSVVNKNIEANLVLFEDGQAFKGWVNPPVNPVMKVFFFNLTNQEAFLEGRELARVEKVGPYVYIENISKVNVAFSDNAESVTFSDKKFYHFDPRLSNGSETDRILMPNIPMFGAFRKMEGLMSGAAVSGFEALLNSYKFGMDKTPFLSLTVKEFLWGYPSLIMSVKTISTCKIEKKTDSEGFSDDWDDDEWEDDTQEKTDPKCTIQENNLSSFGYFMGFNGTVKNKRTLNTGKNDISQKGLFVSYQDQVINGNWSDGKCNMVRGRDPGTLTIGLDKHTPLDLYFSNMCRNIKFVYRKTVVHGGISTYRYVPEETTFHSPRDNPDNSCYCHDRLCLPSGIFDIGIGCKAGSPVYMSWPHFLHGDPLLLSSLEGLDLPRRDEDEFFLDIEPQWGTTLAAHAAFQFNVLLTRDSYHGFRNIKNGRVMLPFLMLEEGVPGPNDVIMEKMSLLMTIAENVKNLTFLALVLLGFICMLPEIVFWSKSCCNCSSKQEVIKPLK